MTAEILALPQHGQDGNGEISAQTMTALCLLVDRATARDPIEGDRLRHLIVDLLPEIAIAGGDDASISS